MHSFSHTHTHTSTQVGTDLNSKGDAEVTRALSQGFSMFVPPAMFPDVKPLIKRKPIPLEHSMLPAIFLISLFSLPCDSRMRLASSSTWLFFYLTLQGMVVWQDFK